VILFSFSFVNRVIAANDQLIVSGKITATQTLVARDACTRGIGAHLQARPTMIRSVIDHLYLRASQMTSALLRSTFALAIVVAAGAATSAVAQTPSDLKARCDQLTSYYDRYGVGRSENSDGARNHTRIAAGIDCQHGDYDKGISSMEALLKNKGFDVPAVPTGIAQPPAPLKPHGEKRREASQ